MAVSDEEYVAFISNGDSQGIFGVIPYKSDGLEDSRMAALTATPPKQDVAFSAFKQEEDSVEEISDNTDNPKGSEDSKCDDPHSSRKIPSCSPSGGGKFTLGIEDGSEFMEEVAFTLQHCALPPGGGQGEGQPPPGHWVSQPHGEKSVVILTRTHSHVGLFLQLIVSREGEGGVVGKIMILSSNNKIIFDDDY